MNLINRHIEADLLHPLPADSVSEPASRKWPIRYDYLEALTIVFDAATITAASLCAGLLYRAGEDLGLVLGQALGSAALVSALFILILKSQGHYAPAEWLSFRRQMRMVATTWAGVFFLLAGIVFALKIGAELSRGSSLIFAALGLVALGVNRTLMKKLLTRGLAERRFVGRNVILVVDRKDAFHQSLAGTLETAGFNVMGSFPLPRPGSTSASRKRLSASVIEHIRNSKIEEVVVGADPSRWEELRELAAELRILPFPITFIPTGPFAEIFQRPRHDLGEVVCIELQRGVFSQIERAAKRGIDLVGAGITLLLLSPLLAMVSLLIKLDSPGPVLFRQQRRGFNGHIFRICKFRTMTVLEDGFSAVQAQATDRRVTRLGKWLRRTSIDELPQLLNVLAGSMSLVGPRPHAVVHDSQFDMVVGNYAFRRRVKPGLTGWAQVHGCRGPTPTAASIEKRVEYDLWYIDNWSIQLDLAILLQTPIEVLRARNAY
ncbi:undecaprenyl-phosphate glucose phosphotransferase [Bradyrhizobium sp.]|uniref:undecaprenyl-phosphate glucose phosphotransferase n=1 Tax=Bradyrhizobium sp. TaxID=376 RepID=UPI002BF69292|nr:undecaprenyl-phosphate glucose phosphotransferase [Bradyrhizobium sp.]HMM89209.1 undecaprenyl-phosphate glucose phosphotransferase [Bradyrhizobium sp.]